MDVDLGTSKVTESIVVQLSGALDELGGLERLTGSIRPKL
jgi:hypothetical protein